MVVQFLINMFLLALWVYIHAIVLLSLLAWSLVSHRSVRIRGRSIINIPKETQLYGKPQAKNDEKNDNNDAGPRNQNVVVGYVKVDRVNGFEKAVVKYDQVQKVVTENDKDDDLVTEYDDSPMISYTSSLTSLLTVINMYTTNSLVAEKAELVDDNRFDPDLVAIGGGDSDFDSATNDPEIDEMVSEMNHLFERYEKNFGTKLVAYDDIDVDIHVDIDVDIDDDIYVDIDDKIDVDIDDNIDVNIDDYIDVNINYDIDDVIAEEVEQKPASMMDSKPEKTQEIEDSKEIEEPKETEEPKEVKPQESNPQESIPREIQPIMMTAEVVNGTIFFYPIND